MRRRACFARTLARLPVFAIGASLCAAPALLPSKAHAVGEQNGRISGVITDKLSAAPLPGATVKVKSSALIGGPRTVKTADDGSYELIALPPGTYEVELSYEGAKPLRRKVVVRQGETFPLDIAWSIEMAEKEVTVIVEERKMTRPDTTQTGTVLTADTQARVATARTYQSITQQVAGVSFNNGQGNPNIKGAMDAHNRYLVDGLDITDPVTNTFSSNINFDSIASVEVLTGGAEAQYNSLGGVINLITAAGGNEWHIDSSLYVNHQSLSAGSQYGRQLYSGTRPFSVLRRPPNASYQANLNLGGPLIRSKLWMNFSFEYLRRESSQPIGLIGVQEPPSQSDRFLGRLKLTYAPSEKHRLTLSVSTDPAYFNNVNQDHLRLAIAEDRQNQGGFFSVLQWDYFASEKANFNLQAGFQYNTIDVGPQGLLGSVDTSGYRGSGRFSPRNDVYDPNQPQHYNADEDTVWYQGGALSRDKRFTVQVDPSIALRGNLLGKHEAKLGIQSRYIRHDYYAEVPGGVTYNDSGGGPGEAGLCLEDIGQTAGCYQRTTTAPFSNTQQGFSVGLFAQDRWQVAKWLRINPGLRFDYGRTTNSVSEVVSSLYGFGPRLGLVFDLTQDGKTIFTAYYGRANEVLSLLAAAYADVTATSSTYEFDQTKKRWNDEPLYKSGGPGGYKLDPDGKPAPHADEVTLSMRREVFGNSAVSLDYSYKKFSNIWDSVEINQIWDPTGQRVVDYADPMQRGQQIFLYTRPDGNWRTYQGVDFVFESRPKQEWDFSVTYTLSWLYGPGAEQFGQVAGQKLSPFYNPRLTYLYDGFLPEDRRHQLKIRASYAWKGLNIGAFLNYASGTPRTKLFFNQNDGSYTYRRSPTGTEPGTSPNDVGNTAEFRLPAVLTVDARISYDLHEVLQKVHLTLIADFFNAFNLDSPTEIQNNDVPSFGQVQSRQLPLRVQLGVRFQY
jgi:outer membrane receptor protein involved in Fe transport